MGLRIYIAFLIFVSIYMTYSTIEYHAFIHRLRGLRAGDIPLMVAGVISTIGCWSVAAYWIIVLQNSP